MVTVAVVVVVKELENQKREEFSLLIESTRTSLSEKRKRALKQLTQLKHLTPLCTSFVFTLTLPRNTIS